jgi:hypothetical protein
VVKSLAWAPRRCYCFEVVAATALNLDFSFPPIDAEIIPADSTRGIYEEALAELSTTERDDAKRIIAQRIRELNRLKLCVAKAEADLERLLKKSVSEIALLG